MLNSWNNKSIFLNKPEFSDDRFERSALILGEDWVSEEIARRLTKMGLDVTLAADAFSPETSTSKLDTALDSLDGQVGQYQALLVQQNQLLKKQFGFVVAAQRCSKNPRYREYGLQKGPRVLSVSELVEMIDRGESLPDRNGLWYQAAFIDDLVGDSDPSVFGQFLDAVERLTGTDHFQAYILTKHLKVASPGLEKRYRDLRRQGVIFFKFDDSGPVFQYESGRWKILFNEPLLKLDFELTPDIIVLDEKLGPPASLAETFGKLIPFEASSPYLQVESPRFNSVLTSKVGLFAVGPSRGVFDRNGILEDIDAVEFEIKKILAESDRIPNHVPVVDKSKCAFCLTCLRLCPHGAITFYDRAEISKKSCLNCGICIAECPMQAISVSNHKSDLDGNWPSGDRNVPLDGCAGKIVLFLCSRSAAQAYKSISFIFEDDVTVFEVNCAGSLETEKILEAFRSGADAVLVGGCFTGNCASIYGNILCKNRVELIGSVLNVPAADITSGHGTSSISAKRSTASLGGFNPDRIRFVHTAGNASGILAKAIHDLKNL